MTQKQPRQSCRTYPYNLYDYLQSTTDTSPDDPRFLRGLIRGKQEHSRIYEHRSYELKFHRF